MTSTNKSKTTALCLILFLTAFTITLTNATTENNYNTNNNLLTNIYEATLTENGYKTNIIINPHTTGIYATENGYKLDLTINTQGIGGSLKENNYRLDLIPEKTFLDIADIAVTNITLSKTKVGQGYTTRINITTSNQALNYETFHLIIKANTTNIKTQTITITSGNSTTITFTWNTTGFTKSKYAISAYAWPVQGETDTADNNRTNGSVTVSWLGDLDGDFDVDEDDLWTFCGAFIDYYKIHVKDANCDFDDNCKIDEDDLWTMCTGFIDYWKAH